MTYNDEGLPYVNLRDCTTPREALRRIEQFLDEYYADVLRTHAARLVLEDHACTAISVHIARMRIKLLNEKMSRFRDVVTILEDVANT
jgi:hypothetical protein